MTTSGTPLSQTLCDFINRAFNATHNPPYYGASMLRYDTLDEFKGEVTDSAVIYTLFQQGKLLGMMVLAPYRPLPYTLETMPSPDDSWEVFLPSSSQSGFSSADSTDEVDAALEEVWICLQALTVDPELHGQGVGGWLLRLFEHEALVYARARRDAVSVTSNRRPTRLRMALTTTLEINAAFYERRGWFTTRKYVHVPGYYGSTVSITTAQLEKVVDLL